METAIHLLNTLAYLTLPSQLSSQPLLVPTGLAQRLLAT